MHHAGRIIAMLFMLVFVTGCATYYQKNQKLMDAVYNGNIEAAIKLLQNDTKQQKSERNRLLFYLNKGTVLFLNQDYRESINYFRKADFFVEDYNKNMGEEALALLTNPKVTTYGGESFEQVMLHYYGALNFFMLNDYDGALVESKRMLSKLQRITDKYKNNNKYKFDAFAHVLSGMAYEGIGDANNAFIAYRNAYRIYKDDYSTKFNTPAPHQLKLDLLRTAYLTGFYDEVAFYEKEFNLKFDKSNATIGSDVVFFWNNGFGPVKDEWSINFTIIPYAGHPGWVEIANWDLGISIPYRVDDDKQRRGLLDMKIIRMALPRYVSRKPVYNQAWVNFNNQKYNFNLAQDVNAIAYKSLEDREVAELTKGLLRVALKQLLAHEAARQNQAGLALAAQLYGAVSEQADTRNWQLLPYHVSYTRINANPGKVQMQFNAQGLQGQNASQTYNLDVVKGKTTFAIAHTMQFSGYSR